LAEIVHQIDQQPEIVVEANQSQRWLQQKLSERGIPAAPVQTTRNKEDKLIDLSIPVSDGTVQLIDWSGDQSDFQELRNQMLSFPDGSHDDVMDSLALVVNHSNLGNTSIFSGSYGGDDDEW
jgi:predicted phage terminase large subunit-like protein